MKVGEPGTIAVRSAAIVRNVILNFRFRPGTGLLGALVALAAAVGGDARAGVTNSWRVFRPLSAGVAVGTNRVTNAGMETAGTTPPIANWGAFGGGYTASTTEYHGGAHSLQCVSVSASEVHGGAQTIVLNQTTSKALKVSGWSKALNVTGTRNADYSVYLDIIYTNGTPLWGQTIHFSVGTHDWEYQEAFILPALPIRQVSCYVLFRNSHTGTVWFDDITVAEVQDAVVQFDGAAVTTVPPNPVPYDSTTNFYLNAGGLLMTLQQDGGTIGGVSLVSNRKDSPKKYASGWLICDRAAGSDWWSVGGWLTTNGTSILQQGVSTNLNLATSVRYTPVGGAIRMQATVSNLMASDRAISLYFALPVSMMSGVWWQSPRDAVPLSQATESGTLSSVELGARNLVSRYPLATVTDLDGGVTLAVPPDQYRPYRLIYNSAMEQFFAAFDLGLSALPVNFPQTATVEVWLYYSGWVGLRGGLHGYYQIFTNAFARNFTNEGIWVAFADIRGITNIADFNIAYHEIGYNPALVRFDDTNGIQSFRYVSEPWSYWMNMPTSLSNSNYATVYNYLLTQHGQGVKAATATLSSGVREPGGPLNFFPAAAPWCPYGAAFYNNASPFIVEPQYSTTKFSNEWNAGARDVYNHPENGRLDGEYIDSFLSSATIPDYSTNHMRTTSFPLAYTQGNPALMTPLIYGTYEMSRAIGSDLRAMGKPFMANTLYTYWPGLPIGIGLFDFAGTEMNCFDAAGNFVPPSDTSLLYARALSGPRPYGFLLNTDFTKVSPAEMESYMRLCAVYGIYPSAFSADAASNNYFEQPGLYERDRSLFRKYIPIVRAMSLAGWNPLTGAYPMSTNVALESYGTNAVTSERYLSMRNLAQQTISETIRLEPMSEWVHPGATWLRVTDLFDGGSVLIHLASSNSFTVTLAGNECRVYAVKAEPQPVPRIIPEGAQFGFQSNRFGFNTKAYPGQVLVIEGGSSLDEWTPLQTNRTPESGLFYFMDAVSDVVTRRFYRVMTPASP